MINSTNEFSGFNLFENLPDEVIQKNIGCYFDINETLTATLVDKRFKVIFEDNTLWKRFYIELGLEAPSINAKKLFPLFKSIHKTIDQAAKEKIDNVFQKERFYSLCISTLVVPELSPLHSFALGKLRENCGLPETLSADELILEAARGHQDYRVTEGGRLLVIKSISNRAAEPVVKDLLRSLVTEGNTMTGAASRCSAAIKALIPFENEPEVKEAFITCLRNHGPHTVWAVLDKFISDPGVVNIVINAFSGGLCGLDKFLKDHLNDPNIVNELLKIVNETDNYHLLEQVISALKPVVDQIPVQQTLCRYFEKASPKERLRFEAAFNRAISNAKLSDEVKKEFRKITVVQQVTDADKILQLNVLTQRKELLSALCDKKECVRAAAAKLLAPLVTDDLEIRNAFIKRVRERDLGEVGQIVVPALANVMHRTFYRKTLIERGCLDKNSSLGLKTIKVLRPYIAETEVREAFLKRLISDESPTIRCELIDCLAPEIEKADVLPLFLAAAKDNLWRQSYHSGTEWQVAAIDKLGAIADKPEVKTVLLNQFNKSYYAVNAACIRALCSDGKMILGPDRLFSELTNESFDVREEARKALLSWINMRSAESSESGV